MKYYTGIGSRECPQEVLNAMTKIGEWLAKHDFILRSGGADGCDLAFEKGCDLEKGMKEIYLPWSGFNGSESNLVLSDKKAFEIAEIYHPYWNNLKQGARKLMARNSHQVLGSDLNTYSEFIICYTKGGKCIGGTAQALRIAKDKFIPVFNFGEYDNIDQAKSEFKKFIKRFIK